jgi:hypothetical protein
MAYNFNKETNPYYLYQQSLRADPKAAAAPAAKAAAAPAAKPAAAPAAKPAEGAKKPEAAAKAADPKKADAKKEEAKEHPYRAHAWTNDQHSHWNEKGWQTETDKPSGYLDHIPLNRLAE